MDTSDPTITFDADGVCNHYPDFYRNVKSYWQTGPEGRRQLETAVAALSSAQLADAKARARDWMDANDLPKPP